MNTEKLIEIVNALKDDFNRTEIKATFGAFVNALQAYVNQMNQNTQNVLSTQTQNLYNVLDKSKIDDFSPGWKQFMIEIDADEIFGSTLKNRIAEILGKNQITATLALEEIRPIFQRVFEIADAVSQLDAGFQNLRMESYALQKDECEFGLVMPRKAIDNNLKEFEKECKDLDFVIGTFNELVTGSRPEIKIREISSSDFILYLALVPTVGAAIAKSIDWLLAKYKELLEIKKMKLELQKAGVPSDNLKGIEAHANQMIEAEVKNIVHKLLSESHTKDKGRKHELGTGLTKSLNMIANRIDRGFNFEIRIEIPPELETDEPESPANIIRKSAENLKFIKNGEGRILELPESIPQKSNAKSKDSEKSE